MVSNSLFPLEPVVRQKRSYMVQNLRLVSEAVCEISTLRLEDPKDLVDYMSDAWDAFPHQEQAWVVLLNTKLRAVGRHLISVGTGDQTLVNPSLVFRAAIVAGAASIVLLHNHPSGEPTPSCADMRITRQIKAAAETIGINLVDHVIVGDAHNDPLGLGYYSFRKAGFL